MVAVPRQHEPHPVEWRVTPGLVPYAEAVATMEMKAAAIADGRAPELVWLLEHPPVYTAGTSAEQGGLVDPYRFPVYATGRGGQYTYHGPGQRVAYVMLNLKARGGDVRAFVSDLARWMIDVLDEFEVAGAERPGRVGVWVDRHLPTGEILEEKIAAIGIRVRRGVTYHGVSLNVSPNLAHFDGIVPCGLAGYGVTSLGALGIDTTMQAVDDAIKRQFQRRF